MSSSPVAAIFMAVGTIGFLALAVWLIARNLISDAPFPLDIPEFDPAVQRTFGQQAIRAIRCMVYAAIWLVIVAAVFSTALGVMGASVFMTTMELIGYALVGFIAWIAVLRYKISLRWPLTGVALCFLAFGGSVMTVVGLIGIGKLIIMSNGRWSVFAGSRLRAETLRAEPRGLVEVHDNE